MGRFKKPASIRQRRQHERLDHVVDRGRIRTGSRDRTIGREVLRDAEMLGERRPRHQPAIRRQRIVRHGLMHSPTGRGKAENTVTQRVNPFNASGSCD